MTLQNMSEESIDLKPVVEQAPFARSRRWMLYLLLGYMFLFVFRPFEYWEILGTLHVERIYAILMLGVLLFWPGKRWVAHPSNYMVVFFIAIMLLSSSFAVDKALAFNMTLDYAKILVFYALMICVIQSEEDLEIFVVAYILIMGLYVGKSAWEFFINDRFWYRMGIKRMMGIDKAFSDPNYFAASIAYSLPFWWASVKLGLRNKFVRILLALYLPLALTAILCSGSRSGMVTSLLFLMLAWLGAKRKVLGLALMACVLAILWFSAGQSYRVRFLSTFIEGIADEYGQKGADASAQGRIAGLEMGFSTFLKHPALGIGPGNFKYSWAGGTGEILGGSSHNLYGQILGELGGGGAFAFSLMIGTFLWTHNKVRRRAKTLIQNFKEAPGQGAMHSLLCLRLIPIACLQGIILLLFNGNFGHNLYRFNFLWIGAMGVIASCLIKQRETKGFPFEQDALPLLHDIDSDTGAKSMN
jgi:O-antigen ligase